MSSKEQLFPQIMRNIENLIEDEEGNIPGNKLLMLGTMVIIMGNMLAVDIFAAHSSHRSHRSHSSHRSGSHGNHGNHSNHGSHESHVSHQSHTSHSNTSSHSNSLYSAEGDVHYSAPSAAKVPGIEIPPVEATEDAFVLPHVNQNIEMPNGTPTSSIMPSFGVPATSIGTKIDAGDIQSPSGTEKIK